MIRACVIPLFALQRSCRRPRNNTRTNHTVFWLNREKLFLTVLVTFGQKVSICPIVVPEPWQRTPKLFLKILIKTAVPINLNINIGQASCILQVQIGSIILLHFVHRALFSWRIKWCSVPIADNKCSVKELSNAREKVTFLVKENSPLFYICVVELER
jgi:hypothetical protein